MIASHTSASWMGSSEHLVFSSSCINGGLGGGGRWNLGGGPHPGPQSKSVSNISHMNVLWTGGPRVVSGVGHGSAPSAHGTGPLSEPGAGHLTAVRWSTKTHGYSCERDKRE